MADLIRANIGGIDSIRGAIAEALNALREEEKKLQECIAKLDPMWEGEAHDAFHADLMQNYQSLVAVDQKIAEAAGFEESAVNEYSKAETEIGEQISSL